MVFLPLVAAITLCVSESDQPAPQINPVPRQVLHKPLAEWTFDQGLEGWVAEKNCVASVDDGRLIVRATADDPYLHRNVELPGGQIVLHMKGRSSNSGPGSIYWITRDSPHRGEDKVVSFPLNHDGKWHEYSATFHAPGTLLQVRLDPGHTPGLFEIDSIRLEQIEPHPLVIEPVEIIEGNARFSVTNHRNEPLAFSAAGKAFTAEANGKVIVAVPLQQKAPVEAVSVEARAKGLPPVRRTIHSLNPDVETEWLLRTIGEYTLRIASNGTMARIEREGHAVAFLAPLVHIDGELPLLKLVQEKPSIRFEGVGIVAELGIQGDELSIRIDSKQPCEGPVVRALGNLDQGLLAGVEYLGKGEHSSSQLDIETAEHIRFAPDPEKVTLPLSALVTDRVSVALAWDAMTLQPVYATPNFIDSADDHRMALRGRKIEAVVRISRERLEEQIAWAVRRRGLPPLPDPPRTAEQQWGLCMKALNGPLKTDKGWGHCVEDRWARHPFADMASTEWRLTAKTPTWDRLVPAGSHVRNDAIYFVTGRVDEWRRIRQAEIQNLLRQQKPDGSFRYQGKFARGHFEDTASGVCARPASVLLEHAWLTGDQDSRVAGFKALEYMKRFRTPRGAQVWEVPLHTPDQLASAYLVRAYVRGFELSGDRTYLNEARRWALSGVPFVYLWGKYPIMTYATPPVYGATQWRAPCWIGLPVQWVGGVYAYSLAMLGPYDDTLDWNHLARGILISAEQQQYPDGPHAGLLPDSITLATQRRNPWRINPCALVSLRLILDGKLDSLSAANDGKHFVCAPFPVTIRDGKAHIAARVGVDYQVLVNGRTIVDITSKGTDEVRLLAVGN